MLILLAVGGIVVAAFATTIFTIVKVTRRGDLRGRQSLLVTVSLLVVFTAAGAAWEMIAWRTFAREAGSFKGMLAHPRPNYVDYDYTPKGHEYEQWGFKVPMAMTITALIVIVAIRGILMYRAGSRVALFGICSAAIVCGGSFVLFSGYNYLIATDFFI